MTTQYKIFVQPVSSSKVLMLIKVSFEILKALSREIDLNKTIVFSKPILMSEFYFIKKSTDLCESADPAYWNENLLLIGMKSEFLRNIGLMQGKSINQFRTNTLV